MNENKSSYLADEFFVRTYDEREAEADERVSALLVVEDHPVRRQVKSSVLVAAVERRDAPRAGKRHCHIVAEQQNAENIKPLSTYKWSNWHVVFAISQHLR